MGNVERREQRRGEVPRVLGIVVGLGGWEGVAAGVGVKRGVCEN